MDFVVWVTNHPRMVHEYSNVRAPIRLHLHRTAFGAVQVFVQNSWMVCLTNPSPQIPTEQEKFRAMSLDVARLI